MSYKKINGVNFHTQVLGQPGSPPLVMLHGLFVGSMASWFFTSGSILSNSYQVLLYDLRGHGRSEQVGSGYDLKTLAKDLDLLTAEYLTSPVTLIGHSYGGLIALHYAMNKPEQVQRLILVDTPLPPFTRTELNEFLKKDAKTKIKSLPGPIQLLFAQGGRRTNRFLQTLHFLKEESSLIDDVISEPPVTKKQLGSVNQPVLCVYGTKSKCLNDGHFLCQNLPNATLTELEGGHYIHLDAYEALNKCIIQFMHKF